MSLCASCSSKSSLAVSMAYPARRQCAGGHYCSCAEHWRLAVAVNLLRGVVAVEGWAAMVVVVAVPSRPRVDEGLQPVGWWTVRLDRGQLCLQAFHQSCGMW